jgi:hypothetical protein
MRKMAILEVIFGPVSDAANGGHSSSIFDLTVGLGILLLTWMPRRHEDGHRRINIWIALGVSAICAVFIFSGIAEFIHGH